MWDFCDEALGQSQASNDNEWKCRCDAEVIVVGCVVNFAVTLDLSAE